LGAPHAFVVPARPGATVPQRLPSSHSLTRGATLPAVIDPAPPAFEEQDMARTRRTRHDIATPGTGAAAQQNTEYTGPATTARGDSRVLIIDDDDGTTALLADVLASDGYAVTTIGTAVGAETLVRHLRPCVIVLDLGLPFRSGAALLEALTSTPATASTPVIVVSALAHQLPPTHAALASAVLAKPFELQNLRNAIRAACS